MELDIAIASFIPHTHCVEASCRLEGGVGSCTTHAQPAFVLTALYSLGRVLHTRGEAKGYYYSTILK